jgi:hypothetical protein
VKITTVEKLPRRPRPKLGGEAKDRERELVVYLAGGPVSLRFYGMLKIP